LNIVTDVYRKYSEYAIRTPNIKKFVETDIKLPSRLKVVEEELDEPYSPQFKHNPHLNFFNDHRKRTDFTYDEKRIAETNLHP